MEAELTGPVGEWLMFSPNNEKDTLNSPFLK